MIDAGKLDQRIRIERPVADNSLDGAGSGTWALVDEVWAEVQDLLPSRDEKVTQGISVASRRARVRIRYREGITSEMRVVHGARVMQIIGGPSRLGNSVGLEMMCEDYKPAGNPA